MAKYTRCAAYSPWEVGRARPLCLRTGPRANSTSARPSGQQALCGLGSRGIETFSGKMEKKLHRISEKIQACPSCGMTWGLGPVLQAPERGEEPNIHDKASNSNQPSTGSIIELAEHRNLRHRTPTDHEQPRQPSNRPPPSQ